MTEETITPLLEEQEFTINMGPQHPSTHGVFRLMLKLQGEMVRRSGHSWVIFTEALKK